MKILVTGFTANYGGMETFLMNYYREMQIIDSSVVIDIISTSSEPAFKDELLKMGGQVHYISRARDKAKVKNELNKIMQENNYDVFWCNKSDLADITYLEVAYKNNIPKRILHSHSSSNMFTGFRRKMVDILHNCNKKKVSKLATDFWACSDYAAEWLFPKEISQGKYKFIPNAVDMDKFKFSNETRETYRTELNLKDKLVIGSVGAFLYAKNPEFILEVFKEIHNLNKNTVLLWVGTGELQEGIEAKIKEYKLEENVKLLGRRYDVAELMQAMDCFLLPSRFEGLPVVAIEAQATGLTVFASSDGITKQTKITDSLHFLTLSDTPKQWAEQILKTDLTHKDNTEQIVASGFEIKSATKNLLKKLGD